MDGWDWRTFASLWGAGLATWLALVRILPTRPRFHVGPATLRSKGETPFGKRFSGEITIVNPAGRAVLIHDKWRIPLRPGAGKLGLIAPDISLREVEEGVSIHMFFAPNAKAKISLEWVGRGSWLVVFSWHQPWLLPFAWLSWVVVSPPRIQRWQDARHVEADEKPGA